MNSLLDQIHFMEIPYQSNFQDSLEGVSLIFHMKLWNIFASDLLFEYNNHHLLRKIYNSSILYFLISLKYNSDYH